MKKHFLVLTGLCVALVALRGADAIDGGAAPVPESLMNRPLREWQLDLTTLGIAWFFVRRGYANWRAGGGFYGFLHGFLYGDKTPDAKARDDARLQAVMDRKGLTQPPFPINSSNPTDRLP